VPEQYPDAVATQLAAGLAALGIAPERFPTTSILAYLELLGRWNSAYSLTAIRNPVTQVSHHVLDSLAILPYLHGNRCLDIGSGPGLPGMILALARPDQNWVLLDSNAKKIRFLRQAQLELQIPNVEIVRARIETYRPEYRFDTVVARALADLSQLFRWAEPLLARGGRLLAMKAVASERELAALGGVPAHIAVHELQVPMVNAPRVLIEIHAEAIASA
jgi:16S rRNA (guanine527-N7)-methyltransferase